METRNVSALRKIFGSHIRYYRRERGWTQADLANVLGRPLQTVNQIINGRKRITPQTAVELAAAFGTSAEVWLNLENAYRLAHVRRPSPAMVRRARKLTARAG